MPQRASHPRRLPVRLEAGLRTKLTVILLQLEIARALATRPRQKASIEAALQATLAAAELLER